jgi:hypothetical protein
MSPETKEIIKILIRGMEFTVGLLRKFLTAKGEKI